MARRLRIFAVASPYPSHAAGLGALARALLARGHDVRVAVPGDLAGRVPQPVVIDRRHLPGGAWPRLWQRLGHLSGLAAPRAAAPLAARWTRAVARWLPRLAEAHRSDVILADQFEPAAAIAADSLGRPLVLFCGTLALDRCAFPTSLAAAAQPPPPLAAHAWAGFCAPIRHGVNAGRRYADLPLAWQLHDPRRAAAAISQLPPALAAPWDPPLTHVGGVHLQAPAPAGDFPWDRLDCRPLVYAAFGTLFNHHAGPWQAVLAATAQLPVQLVLSLGGGTWNAATPADAIVVPWAPQRRLLERAAVFVTHAGINGVNEAIAAGVPMLCLPLAADQFAIASRLTAAGAAVALERPSPEAVRAALLRLLHEPAFRAAATALQADQQRAGGAARACALIEDVA